MKAISSRQSYSPPPKDISSLSGQIFDDIRFIRLTQWRECSRSTILVGGTSCAGQIFRRFELTTDPGVMLEFWYRGNAVSTGCAEAFNNLLLQEGDVALPSLEAVKEVWAEDSQFCPVPSPHQSLIEAAEVGQINGRRILAIWWVDALARNKFLSIYVDANRDGGTVHEIHFSIPISRLARHATVIADTLRSFQWRSGTVPPPLSTQKLGA